MTGLAGVEMSENGETGDFLFDLEFRRLCWRAMTKIWMDKLEARSVENWQRQCRRISVGELGGLDSRYDDSNKSSTNEVHGRTEELRTILNVVRNHSIFRIERQFRTIGLQSIMDDSSTSLLSGIQVEGLPGTTSFIHCGFDAYSSHCRFVNH